MLTSKLHKHLSLLLIIVVCGRVGADAQNRQQQLEFDYTKTKKYGVDGGLYFKHFLRSLVTFKKRECPPPEPPSNDWRYAAENFIYLKGDSVMLSEEGRIQLRSGVLLRHNEYAVAEVIQRAQYPCGSLNQINTKLHTRGRLLKPFFTDRLRKSNGDFLIQRLPVTPQGEVFFNLHVVKRGGWDFGEREYCHRCIASWLLMWHLKGEKFDSIALTKVRLIDSYIRSERVNVDGERWNLTIRIPFGKATSTLTPSATNDIVHALEKNIPDYAAIHHVTISAYASVEGQHQVNAVLHEKRATAIFNLIRSKVPGTYTNSLNSHVSTDSLFHFISETVWDTLRQHSPEQLSQILNANGTLKEKLEDFLSKDRYGVVSIQLKVRDSDRHRLSYLSGGLTNSIATKDIAAATRFQNALLTFPFHSVRTVKLKKGERSENGAFILGSPIDGNRQNVYTALYEDVSDLDYDPDIPFEAEYVDLHNNRLIHACDYGNCNDDELRLIYQQLYAIAPSNKHIVYNNVALMINGIIDNYSKGYDTKAEMERVAKYVQMVADHDEISDSCKAVIDSRWFLLQTLDGKIIDNPIASKLLDKFSGLGDVLFLANRYGSQRRYLEAAEILNVYTRKKLKEISSPNTEEYYRQRLFVALIYYNYMATKSLDSQGMENALKWFYQTESDYFCSLFDMSIYNFQLLEIPAVKKFYCNKCGFSSN